MKLIVIPSLCMLLFLATVGMKVQAEETNPCKEEIARFCKDVKPGGGKLVSCLKEHESELSGACKAHQEESRKKISTLFQACQDDASKFCKDIKPRSGRIFKCLKEHEGELSAECKGQMDKRKKITGAD